MSNSTAETDKVKLGEDGWRERYYVHKFQLNSEDECDRVQRELVIKYIEGLSWVMHYYYEGVCSWQWFYPYHYAPFASDFHDFGHLKITFTLGKPFKPFDQLMGVLPAASAHALPLAYGKLMKDDSPIADLYPADFEIDMEGKRFSWQGLCKLPFIDEARLLSEIAKVENSLTDEEKRRNSLGLDLLFFHKSNPMAVRVSFSEKDSQQELLNVNTELEIDPKVSDGMNGYITVNQHPVCPAEISSPLDCWPVIVNSGVVTVSYKFPPPHPHIPNLPEGVSLPKKSVSKRDINPPALLLYDGASNRLYSRKLMPMSVYGPDLSRLAHQLVYRFIGTCKNDDKKIPKPSVGQQDSETALTPISIVSKMNEIIASLGAPTTGKASASNPKVTGKDKRMVKEVKSKKRKRKAIKELPGASNPVTGKNAGASNDKATGEDNRTVTEVNSKKRRKRSKEKQEGDDAAGADSGETEKTVSEAKSEKRKRKAEKKQEGDANGKDDGAQKTVSEAESKKKKRKAEKKQEGDADGKDGGVQKPVLEIELKRKKRKAEKMREGEATGDENGETKMAVTEAESKKKKRKEKKMQEGDATTGEENGKTQKMVTEAESKRKKRKSKKNQEDDATGEDNGETHKTLIA
ncbi:5'-3' exoribonuclease 3 [Linum grandiflorum]